MPEADSAPAPSTDLEELVGAKHVREVPVVDVGHPLADRIGTSVDGTGFVVTESRSRVVRLTPARSSLLAAAVRDGNRPLLVTDELSLLTPALNRVWHEGGGSWVVREPGGGLRDGATGGRVGDLEHAGTLGRPRTVDDLAVSHLRPSPADTLQLTVIVALRHPARSSTVLGGAVAALSEALLGRRPRSWGPHEPTLAPWDRDALTALVRDQMPDPTLVVVTGGGLRATVTAQRTEHGVEEIAHVTLAAGPLDTEVDGAGIVALNQRLQLVLEQLAQSAMPLVALATVRPGRSDLLVGPFLTAPPFPTTLLVGAPAVRAFGLDLSHLTEGYRARSVGRPRIPALLVDLGTEGVQAWQTLGAVLDEFDPELLAEALGIGADAVHRARRAAPASDEDDQPTDPAADPTPRRAVDPSAEADPEPRRGDDGAQP